MSVATVRVAPRPREFVAVRGTWGEPWQRMLELDPAFVRAYLDFSAVPWRREPGALSPKVRELLSIAVDAAATHLYTPGVRQHVQGALDAGATPHEIMEVLELTSTLGIHAANIGVPLLVEVLTEEGLRDGPAPLDERQERLKAEVTATWPNRSPGCSPRWGARSSSRRATSRRARSSRTGSGT